MKRGSIVIVILLVIAISAAGLSVWYHYQNQRRPLEFWGPATAHLIDRADEAELLALGEPDRGLELTDDTFDAAEPEEEPDAEPRVKALEFNQVPWIVVDSKDAAGAKGLSNLRRALVLDRTFEWSDRAVDDDAEPHWQYAMSMNDGRNWATVLFDFDSRQVGLTGGRKTIRLAPETNADFRQFFAEQFPPDAKDSPPDQHDETKNEGAEQDDAGKEQGEQDKSRNGQDDEQE